MRERVFIELRLRRFGLWQFAVVLVAGAAVAVLAAWAAAMWDSQPDSARALVVVAAGLSLATGAIAWSLARVSGGVLTCSDGVWTFADDAGVRHSGTLEVAIDLGAFLLLRLVDGRRTRAWLPVQRRGVEADWHPLRCALYAPPPPVAGSSAAPALPPG